MLASQHFQDSIDPPSRADIVVLIVWSRLGTLLPEKTAVREYRAADGRVPVTGTEWEFEDALSANQKNGSPDLLAFRRNETALTPVSDASRREKDIRQYEALTIFWSRYFKDGDQFVAGAYEYTTLEEFDTKVEQALGKLIEQRITKRREDRSRAIWLKGSPFRGLLAYDFGDAASFFGREAEKRESLTRLQDAADRGTAFLLISGASGSGKSSLARAGLLPALVAAKAVANVGLWRRASFRPGEITGDPILALARALLSSDSSKGEGLPELAGSSVKTEELAAHLRAAADDPGFLFKKALRELAEAERERRALLRHEEARLVLLVDQLEEIFTRTEISPDDRAVFLRLLANLARSGVVWIVATIRSDLWHRASGALVPLVEAGARFDLEAPNGPQLHEMICQPAIAAGIAFEKHPETEIGLDDVIADAAAAEPGVLPLLSVL